MLGTGLDLSAPALKPATAALHMVTAGSDTLYVKAPTSWGTALAIRFQRNLGGSGPGDLGPPWTAWRRTGTFEIASLAADPAVPLFTYGADAGSFDYALTESSTLKFGGSYHGGETVTSEGWLADGAVFEPASGAMLAGRFELARTSTIAWAADRTMAVSYSLRIESGGALVEAVSLSSTAAFTSSSYVGMDIFARQFDEVRLGSGPVDIEAVASHDIASADQRDVTFRSPSTGHTVRIRGNAADMPGFLRTFAASQTARIKFYPQLASTAGAPFGSKSCQRRIDFGKGAPNRFAYSAARDGLTGATRGGEGAPTIDAAADPDCLLFDRSNTATAWIDRYWILGNLEQGSWRINLNYVKSGTGSVGTSLVVTRATDGSVLTPAPIVNTGFANVTDHFDFVVADNTGSPVAMHIRMGTAAGSTDRLRVTSFNLEKL